MLTSTKIFTSNVNLHILSLAVAIETVSVLVSSLSNEKLLVFIEATRMRPKN